MVNDPISAELKSVLYWGADVSADRSAFDPSDVENFGVSAQIFIGPSGDTDSNSFDITVCSPRWFAAKVDRGGWSDFLPYQLAVLPDDIVVGANLWFMRRWDEQAFLDGIRATCAQASPGPDWGTVADRIGRIVPWELAFRFDSHLDRHFGRPWPPSSPE